LGNCISKLSEKKSGYLNWRDSKLTRILKDTLGGNSQTVMISCINKEGYSYENTLNTLNYTLKARKIQKEVKKGTIEFDIDKKNIVEKATLGITEGGGIDLSVLTKKFCLEKEKCKSARDRSHTGANLGLKREFVARNYKFYKNKDKTFRGGDHIGNIESSMEGSCPDLRKNLPDSRLFETEERILMQLKEDYMNGKSTMVRLLDLMKVLVEKKKEFDTLMTNAAPPVSVDEDIFEISSKKFLQLSYDIVQCLKIEFDNTAKIPNQNTSFIKSENGDLPSMSLMEIQGEIDKFNKYSTDATSEKTLHVSSNTNRLLLGNRKGSKPFATNSTSNSTSGYKAKIFGDRGVNSPSFASAVYYYSNPRNSIFKGKSQLNSYKSFGNKFESGVGKKMRNFAADGKIMKIDKRHNSSFSEKDKEVIKIDAENFCGPGNMTPENCDSEAELRRLDELENIYHDEDNRSYTMLKKQSNCFLSKGLGTSNSQKVLFNERPSSNFNNVSCGSGNKNNCYKG
jgi:hypothetical protein